MATVDWAYACYDMFPEAIKPLFGNRKNWMRFNYIAGCIEWELILRTI